MGNGLVVPVLYFLGKDGFGGVRGSLYFYGRGDYGRGKVDSEGCKDDS